jgi:hypothetical protein
MKLQASFVWMIVVGAIKTDAIRRKDCNNMITGNRKKGEYSTCDERETIIVIGGHSRQVRPPNPSTTCTCILMARYTSQEKLTTTGNAKDRIFPVLAMPKDKLGVVSVGGQPSQSKTTILL